MVSCQHCQLLKSRPSSSCPLRPGVLLHLPLRPLAGSAQGTKDLHTLLLQLGEGLLLVVQKAGTAKPLSL